jgi:hypothetical protein
MRFLQKNLDTLSRARADLRGKRAQIDLQIDDDAAGERWIYENGKTSIA